MPADRRADMGGERLEQARVVLDAELVGDGQEQRVGGGNRRVARELLRDRVGLAGVAAPEAGADAVEVADLVLAAALAAEIGAVAVGDDRQHAAADRDARLTLPAGLRPGRAVALDLLRLKFAERHAGVLAEERRALQVHPLRRRPLRR